MTGTLCHLQLIFNFGKWCPFDGFMIDKLDDTGLFLGFASSGRLL